MSEGNTTSGKGWRLFGGDCRETLAALPEQSVHCCVTSPPYFGLRDYGTATWDGGHADCGHIAPALGGTGKETLVGTTAAGNGTRLQQYRETCGKCGATRKDAQIGLEQTPDCGERNTSRLVLRENLTHDELAYVLGELVKCGLL